MLIHVNWDRFITSWSTSYSSPVQPSDETKWETKQSLLREWQVVPWCIIMWHMEWLSLNPFTAIPMADLQGILALSSHRLGQLSRNLWKRGFQFPTGQYFIPVLYVMLRWEDLMALNLWIHSCCSVCVYLYVHVGQYSPGCIPHMLNAYYGISTLQGFSWKTEVVLHVFSFFFFPSLVQCSGLQNPNTGQRGVGR